MTCSTPAYYIHSLGPVSVARVLICKQCHKYVASMNDLLSRGYSGAQSPKAGLFDNASNVSLGERKILLMRTGAHTVREIRCIGCESYIGWKILQAHEEREKWKEGAYVLERSFLLVHSVVESGEWENRRWQSPPLRLKVIDDLKSKRRNKPLPRLPISVAAH